MGAGQSTSGPSSSTAPKQGLHVLRVTPSSPASFTSLEPFFDFIIGYEGAEESAQSGIDASKLERIVESHEGQALNLLVWNSQNQDTRVVPIVPSREWSMSRASGADPREPDAHHKPSLLGLSMRICEPELSLENVWHVMDVLEGSPAESAGLVPYGDWIIGWSEGALSAEGDFYDVVESHIDKPLRVFVYSHDFHTIREVVLIPNRHWGGEGLLGCVFGYGLLHRIPPSIDREPGTLPPELEEDDEEDMFVPMDTPHANQFIAHANPPQAGSQTDIYHRSSLSNGTIVHPRLSSPPTRDSRSTTPVRTDSLAYTHVRTPTPTRAFGLNGTVGLGLRSPPPRDLTSSPLRPGFAGSYAQMKPSAIPGTSSLRHGDRDDEDSVAETDSTEVTQTSLGSLTSVE